MCIGFVVAKAYKMAKYFIFLNHRAEQNLDMYILKKIFENDFVATMYVMLNFMGGDLKTFKFKWRH